MNKLPLVKTDDTKPIIYNSTFEVIFPKTWNVDLNPTEYVKEITLPEYNQSTNKWSGIMVTFLHSTPIVKLLYGFCKNTDSKYASTDLSLKINQFDRDGDIQYIWNIYFTVDRVNLGTVLNYGGVITKTGEFTQHINPELFLNCLSVDLTINEKPE